jgi:hypothetical protein
MIHKFENLCLRFDNELNYCDSSSDNNVDVNIWHITFLLYMIRYLYCLVNGLCFLVDNFSVVVIYCLFIFIYHLSKFVIPFLP